MVRLQTCDKSKEEPRYPTQVYAKKGKVLKESLRTPLLIVMTKIEYKRKSKKRK